MEALLSSSSSSSSLPSSSPSLPSAAPYPDDVDAILSELARETLSDVLSNPPPRDTPDGNVTTLTATNTLLRQMLADDRFVNQLIPRVLSNPHVCGSLPQLLESPFILQSLQYAFRDPQLLSAAVDPMLRNVHLLLPLLSPGQPPQPQSDSLD
jgi:hypothetical protein